MPSAFKEAQHTWYYYSRSQASNYRAVSSIPVMSKTLEHAVVRQMVSHLHSAGLMPQHQLAYRKGQSTEMALSKSVPTWSETGQWQPHSASIVGLVGHVWHGRPCHIAGALIEVLWHQRLHSAVDSELPHWPLVHCVSWRLQVIETQATLQHPSRARCWAYFCSFCTRPTSVVWLRNMECARTSMQMTRSCIFRPHRMKRPALKVDCSSVWMQLPVGWRPTTSKLTMPRLTLCIVRLAGARISWAAVKYRLVGLLFSHLRWFATLVSFLTSSCHLAFISVSLSVAASTNLEASRAVWNPCQLKLLN